MSTILNDLTFNDDTAIKAVSDEITTVEVYADIFQIIPDIVPGKRARSDEHYSDDIGPIPPSYPDDLSISETSSPIPSELGVSTNNDFVDITLQLSMCSIDDWDEELAWLLSLGCYPKDTNDEDLTNHYPLTPKVQEEVMENIFDDGSSPEWFCWLDIPRQIEEEISLVINNTLGVIS